MSSKTKLSDKDQLEKLDESGIHTKISTNCLKP